MNPETGEKARLLERLARDKARTPEERDVLREAATLMRARTGEQRSNVAPEAAAPATVSGADAEAILWTDGAARGNPGPSGIGALLTNRSGRTLAEVSDYIGETTNNVAEYRALLAGLERALQIGVRSVEVRADSQLMIRQLEGLYKVKMPHLKPLFEKAKQLLARFESHRLRHVPREENSGADRLANLGIDAR